ncbi:glycosyltransferase [Alphaproteobacteria bacterium]|nr:glycosyltransferase [Alphaproteobacteria bacterium]
MIKVSVLLPIHKESNMLHEAIISLKNQIFESYEIIILIDGINEKLKNTLIKRYNSDILKKFIIVKYYKKKLGLTNLLNKGILSANANLIMRNDYDDLSNPLRMQKQFKIFQNDKNIKMVYSYFYFLKNNKKLSKRSPNFSKKKLRNILIYKNPIAHSSVMFDKNHIIKLGLYNENFKVSQDFELWGRVINNNINAVSLIREYLVKIRLNNENISSLNSVNQRSNSVIICLQNKFYPRSYIYCKDISNFLLINNLTDNEKNYFYALSFAYLYETRHDFKFNLNILISVILIYITHKSLLLNRLLNYLKTKF